MTRDLVAGVDTSTQSCTMVLRRRSDGAVVGQARHPHPVTSPPRSEQDPKAWWSAFLACCKDLAADLGRVAAISVGGQGHGLVMLDAADAALRPVKLWNDTESAPDAVALLKRLPAADWAARTGSVPAPALTVSKLAWTERTHPGLVARAARIMLPFDYMVYRMSGRSVTERGGSTGTGYFNPFTNAWDPGLADLAVPGIDWPAVLPEIIGSGDPAGTIPAASGLGALEGAVVGAGSGDNMTAALGMAIRPGDTAISLGTSGTVYGISDTGVIDPTGAINGYADATGRFLPMITTLNAAKVTDTIRRLIGTSSRSSMPWLSRARPAPRDGAFALPRRRAHAELAGRPRRAGRARLVHLARGARAGDDRGGAVQPARGRGSPEGAWRARRRPADRDGRRCQVARLPADPGRPRWARGLDL
ncbi:MAG: FGGY family carbohydrate kinase [Paracoccaceae bacterium]